MRVRAGDRALVAHLGRLTRCARACRSTRSGVRLYTHAVTLAQDRGRVSYAPSRWEDGHDRAQTGGVGLEYVSFGGSGLKVSRIAFGLGFRTLSDQREGERMIERALGLGGNRIDCANVYGPMDDRAYAGMSEQVLGRAVKGRRDNVIITSKVGSAVGAGPNDAGNSRHHIIREVERSLRRLDTDHIDIYLMHMRDSSTPIEEAVRAMGDLVTQGKIRYWGVSNFAAWQLCKSLWTAGRPNAPQRACIQNPYSLLNRELEREVLPLCRDEEVAIEAYSPLAVGRLSGRYKKGETPPPAPLG